MFNPDGLTSNPTITLYRGQTYVFNVNAPRNSFYIRSSNTVGNDANYTKGVTNSGTQNGKVTFKSYVSQITNEITTYAEGPIFEATKEAQEVRNNILKDDILLSVLNELKNF